jgi:hypothetical protein
MGRMRINSGGVKGETGVERDKEATRERRRARKRQERQLGRIESNSKKAAASRTLGRATIM